MTLRLKRLEIQGFKSFANRTVFDLAGGITAIVGPNGSGKSNLSEAVRWVLGEQSNLALRGRRGEDVIFAGTSARAALGMAEVGLTLDNSSGELALDYNEVTIARRIFRDGETHYLINGARVRLRDLVQVTVPFGQSYTVIGQGLVDAALSARPEERRGLFEHAAGIVQFRIKRSEAERRLAETEANCARLSDLRDELEPRLRSLERAARHAQEYDDLLSRLRALQRQLYADLWRELSGRVAATEAAEQSARRAREEASAEVARLNALIETHRVTTEAQVAERRGLAGREAAIARQLEPLRRELAIGEERLSDLRRRSAETQQRIEAVEGHRSALADEARQCNSELEAQMTALAETGSAIAEIERTLATAEQAHLDAQRAERELVATISSVERDRLAIARRRASLAERGAALEREGARLTDERASLASRADAGDVERQKLSDALDRLSARRSGLLSDEGEAREATKAALASEHELSGRLAAAEQRVSDERTRLDSLRKLVESGEGLYSGARAVLAADRAGQLTGILGPVSTILQVPAALETAIEVALGGHLQDIVVERWSDAEAAIAYLKRRNAGRATFQPLDTQRPQSTAADMVPQDPGVAGVAADLVSHDDRFAGLVRGLLGRVLVVDDLTAARRILSQLRGGWSVVTRAGEIARAAGSVTGGSAVRESGILARERALRELPERLAETERLANEAADALNEATVALRESRERLETIERERHDLDREGDDLRHALARHDIDARALRAAIASADQAMTDLAAAEERVSAELAASESEERDLAERLVNLERERTAAGERAQALDQADSDDRRRLAERRAELARAEERLHGLQRQERSLAAQQATLDDELVELSQRRATLRQAEHDLVTREATWRKELAAAEREAENLAGQLRPLDMALTAARQAEMELATSLHDANEAALRRESVVGTRAVETAACRSERDALARRIVEDLELDSPDALLDDRREVMTADDRATLTTQVDRLATRLRRLGGANPEILVEYENERERWKKLTDGLSDVESAARSLRGVLAELDATMRERFSATFAHVAAEFSDAFTDLFGGGSAQLVLAEDDGDSPGGIEIIAQPPGKRLQSLAQLSGGERALTAASLLFAILRVNPSPFCVLDEVDAALDESNVIRFRERLRRLAKRTQFVVITHNRGTIEGADTLYGITMGTDGVSRVLSLRLDAVANDLNA